MNVPLIRVELVPPPRLAGISSLEQEFYMVANPTDWRRNPDIPGHHPRMLSANVSPARVNLGMVNAIYEVPIMLYYEPTTIRFTAYRASRDAGDAPTTPRRPVWQIEMPYLVPEEYRKPPASVEAARAGDWQSAPRDERGNPREVRTLSVEELISETAVLGPEKLVAFDVTNQNVSMIMRVQLATQANGKSLTWYGDRVYALTGLTLFLSDMYYKMLV